MRVDNAPIIANRFKLDVQVLDSIQEESHKEDALNNNATCTCSSQCQLFRRIPVNEGIMIMMHEPNSNLSRSTSNGECGDDGPSCTCLKIQPQSDCNLAEVHPNIYIPSGLLDYPERIVKYGGGGSGVTVFGGYHPELGSLVMKHGGHKDLLELVSLYKIERELQVRGKSMAGMLHRLYSRDATEGETNKVKNSARKNKITTVMKKIGSQPLLSRVGSLFPKRKSDSTPNLSDSTSSATTISDIGMSISTSVDGISSMQKKCTVIEDADDYNTRLKAIENAIHDMKERIPAFRMVYISPMHLRERRAELTNSSFRTTFLNNLNISFDGLDARVSRMTPSFEDHMGKNMRVSVKRQGRAIGLFGSTDPERSSIRVHSSHVDLCFGGSYRLWNGDEVTETEEPCTNDNPGHTCTCAANNVDSDIDGYKSLLAFVNQLYHHMQFNNWKITLAQQTIGTSSDDPTRSAPTASYLLAKGLLRGPLLNKLLDEEIRIIRNLQLLTLPNEVDVLDGVRLEYEMIKGRMASGTATSAADISNTANAFVGKAIHKNFHPESGRFVLLYQFGIDLRDGMVHLRPNELAPASHLQKILNDCFERDDECGVPRSDASFRKSSLEDTFDLASLDDTPDEEDPLKGNPLYIHGLDQWQNLLGLALSMKNPNATCRIWTCGLTDGGLHNLFLGDQQVWMFDLGEPQLETIPGFLTKFLMSFFHTLGMEEDDNGDWVVRFVQNSNKLSLTEETKEILPKVFEAFNTATDRLIKELFGGDKEVQLLLLRYVMTQLVSDAAFCIEKWRIKGGGDKERSDHQYYLEKWLWRSLWDLYICEEIRRRYICRQHMKRQCRYRSFEASDLGPIDESS